MLVASQGSRGERTAGRPLDNKAPLTLVEQHQVTGSNGSKLALIEYEGVPPSTPTGDPLHFLAVIASDGDHVALATLTATADEFANVRPKIEPYLLTLQTT